METKADGKQMRFDAEGSDTVREKYEEVIEQIWLPKEAADAETVRKHLLKAERLREGYILSRRAGTQRVRDADIEDTLLCRRLLI